MGMRIDRTPYLNIYNYVEAHQATSNPGTLRNIDTAGHRSVVIAVSAGAAQNIALTNSKYYEITLQHSDTTTLADYEDVPTEFIDGDTPYADGVLARDTENLQANRVHTLGNFAYMGPKRYLKLGINFTGSHNQDVLFTATVIRDRGEVVS